MIARFFSRQRHRPLRALLSAALLSLSLPAQSASTPAITLIIDDLGYNLRHGLRAVRLPGEVSYAVLPHTPYSKRLATTAHELGKTVLLHAPMTNVHHRSPGPGTLNGSMNKADFSQTLEKALADVPFARGINNHMGSELTQDKTRMQWLMETVRQRRMFFIDSRTTAASVAASTARENGIPSMSRDVFLDHIRTPQAVNEAFDRLLKQARRNGYAVGIGHPHKVTLDMLEARLPELKELGIRLVSVDHQLLAIGQRYPEQQRQLPDNGPVLVRRQDSNETPARSPLLWKNTTLAQLDRIRDLAADPRQPLSRKPVLMPKKEAIEQRTALPDSPEGRALPHYRQGVRPSEESGVRRDLSRQQTHTPDSLKPVAPALDNSQRRIPAVISTPN